MTQLAEVLPMSRQAVSRHTKTLEDAGLLIGMKSGREHRYRVSVETLAIAGEWLQKRTASWEDALDRLSGFLESGGD